MHEQQIMFPSFDAKKFSKKTLNKKSDDRNVVKLEEKANDRNVVKLERKFYKILEVCLKRIFTRWTFKDELQN